MNHTTNTLSATTLIWKNTSNILSATNIVSSGLAFTNLNASYKTSGTLKVNGSGLSDLNASNVTSGTFIVSRGGIGTTSLISNQILKGNGTNAINQSSNFLLIQVIVEWVYVNRNQIIHEMYQEI